MNYSLRALQLAYMEVSMNDESDTHNQCVYCWRSDCNCESKMTVENDPFLNFQDEYENEVEFSLTVNAI